METVFRLSDFVARSPGMSELVATARRVAGSDSSLLILGETGVGKEWLARAIHAESRRSPAPFRAVNCAALTEGLLESELFGHEAGAFTGAVRARKGYFELAHRGTLFLDEIAEIPPHLQAKLLRVLQEHRVQPLGSEHETAVDVRVMAATNQDLQAGLRNRSFRPDLYYRLSVVTLTLPPLRQREEDLPILIDRHLHQISQRLGRRIEEIVPAAREALQRYRWPGNLREMVNVLERAVLLSEGPQISIQDLPEGILLPDPPGTLPVLSVQPNGLNEAPRSWPEVRRQALESAERSYFTHLLKLNRGAIGETARQAGITPRSLHQKMKALGLKKKDFR